jgi:hypothetical protein
MILIFFKNRENPDIRHLENMFFVYEICLFSFKACLKCYHDFFKTSLI